MQRGKWRQQVGRAGQANSPQTLAVSTLRKHVMNTPAEVATSTSHDSSVSGQPRDCADVELPSGWIAAALSGHGLPPLEESSTAVAGNAGNAGDADASLQKKKWSGMRLVDTVALDDSGEIEYWLFTAKTGHITSKKRARDRVKIAERFERFALANPRNTEGHVALASNCRDHKPHEQCAKRESHEPRERVVLGKAALFEAMTGPQVPEEMLGATLQCYLRPQNGSNSCLRGCYRGRNQPCSVLEVSPLYQLPSTAVSAARAESPRESPIADDFPGATKLRNEVERVIASLVAFLEPRLLENKQQQQTICNCDAEFIVDDNGELWMTSLPRVTTTAAVDIVNQTIQPIRSAKASSSFVDSNPSSERSGRDHHDDGGGGVVAAERAGEAIPPTCSAEASFSCVVSNPSNERDGHDHHNGGDGAVTAERAVKTIPPIRSAEASSSFIASPPSGEKGGLDHHDDGGGGVVAVERAGETIPPIQAPSSSVNSNPSSERLGHGRAESGGDATTTMKPAHNMPPLGKISSTHQVAPIDGGGGSPLGSARKLDASDLPPGESSPTTGNCSYRLDQEKTLSGSGRALPAISTMVGDRSDSVISTMLGARSDRGDHNDLGGKQGEITPIIEKKDGVYVANVHASALRGLCSWREVSCEESVVVR